MGQVLLCLFIYHLFSHPLVSSGDPKYEEGIEEGKYEKCSM